MFDNLNLPNQVKINVAIIGLGYVGLPLAVLINKTRKHPLSGKNLKRNVVGYDISKKRIKELKNNFDCTKEISRNQLINATSLSFTSSYLDLVKSDIFIVTVPTPIDKAKRPDLTALSSASKLIGKIISLRDKDTIPIIVYESTVYPGATEEICVPIIEKYCNGQLNIDFLCGYSPERINPSDNQHTLDKIIKVTSGSNKIAAEWIDSFYSSFINAGTHRAPSIKIAEAAKVIENTQRDINIALINEIALICRKLGIDTLDVLNAAGTKWNFLKFKPGLVGGHCIGVDPYYLTYKAQKLNYIPQVVLAGRRINDSMGVWVVQEIILEMAKRSISACDSKLLILGYTFKDNCSDIRNTQILEISRILREYNVKVSICDPYVDLNDPILPKNQEILYKPSFDKSNDVVLVTLSHKEFTKFSRNQWLNLLKDEKSFIFDLKGIAPRDINTIRI